VTGVSEENRTRGHIVSFDDLDHTRHAHEFVGADHGAPFCLIVVHTPPGGGPAVHRHPYLEAFIVEQGTATFRIGDTEQVVEAGHIVVSPAGEAHGFTNSGEDELRLVAVHGAERFTTEWLQDVDQTWASRPRR